MNRKRILPNLLIVLLIFLLPAAAETFEGATRSEVLSSLGTLRADGFHWVTHLEGLIGDGLQRAKVTLAPDYTPGRDAWLVGDGVAADFLADLDGDGQDEWLLLTLNADPAVTSDQLYWTEEWWLLVYVDEGQGWIPGWEFPLALGGAGERSVKVLPDETGAHVLVSAIVDSGSGAAARLSLYGAEGWDFRLEAAAVFDPAGESWVALPEAMLAGDEWMLWDAMGRGEAALKDLGLTEGVDWFVHSAEKPLITTQPGLGQRRVDREALKELQALAEHLPEGITLTTEITQAEQPMGVEEDCALGIEAEGTLLMWLKETTTEEGTVADLLLNTTQDHGLVSQDAQEE